MPMFLLLHKSSQYFYHLNKLMHQSPFFHTEHLNQSPSHQHFIEKKIKLGTYVSNLDDRINKAMNFQNRIIERKKNSLLNTLEKMKDQVYKESQKTRKIEEFFHIHCEKILQDDISKWDGNMNFFRTLFEAYDCRIKEKERQVKNKKQQIKHKTAQLKQLLRSLRKPITIPQLSTRIAQKQLQATTDRNSNLTRVKTETSLPSLNRGHRVKTVVQGGISEQMDVSEMKNYMKPIKSEKNIEESSSRQSMLEMLNWYKENLSSKQTNWFEKVVFVDRNYKKIKDYVHGIQLN